MTESAAPATENQYPWRVGRKAGRTIYMQLGTEASDADPLIGVMDSAEIAAEAVAAHNYRLLIGEGGNGKVPQEFDPDRVNGVPLEERLNEHLVNVLLNNLELCDLLSSLVDDSECRFDHHGGCQEHGYLSLEPGEMCPNERAKRLVEEATADA